MSNYEVNSSRQIKLGSLMAYLAIGVNMLAGLIYTPWMVDNIGQGNYGLFTLSTSLISMFVMDFGLSAAVTRFISKYNALNDQDSINNFLGIVYKLFLFIDGIICVVLIGVYFFIDIIYQGLTVNEIEKLKVIYIITACFSLFSFPFVTLNGILTSYEKFIYQKACDLFQRLFNMITIIIALSLGYGLYTLVTLNAVSNLLTILLKLRIIRKKIPVKVNFNYKSKKMLHDVLGFSIWSTIVSVAQRFIFNIIPTILGALSGSVSIAIFGVAATLEGYVYTFSTAINGMFLPKVSRIIAKKESDKDVLPLMIRVGRIQLVIVGLLMVGFVSLGKEFIYLWMGEDFSRSYLCAVLLMIPSFIELPQHIAYMTVIAMNKVRLQSYVYIGMAVINIVLSIILTRYIGEIGASISICSAYLFRTAAMNVIYYKKLKINILTFFKECHLKMGIPILFSFLLGSLLNYIITTPSWNLLIVKACIITCLYLLIIWIFALNQYEKNLFTSFIKRTVK